MVSILSRRESEVLGLVSLGLTNNEIATRLDVTVHAIKFHLASVYRKLGVTNRTEAVIAFVHGRSFASVADDTKPVSS